MYYFFYIVIAIIFCVIPLPLQILVFLGDLVVTGIGIDEIFMIFLMIISFKIKHED
jgi:hypothetical protein